MTKREFYVAVSEDGNISEELRNYAKDEIAKMDERNAKRSEKPSKTALANVPIKADIMNLLTEATDMMDSPAIGEALSISTQKAGSLCRQLVDEGKLTVEDRKVPKKGTMKFYGIPKTDTEDTED